MVSLRFRTPTPRTLTKAPVLDEFKCFVSLRYGKIFAEFVNGDSFFLSESNEGQILDLVAEKVITCIYKFGLQCHSTNEIQQNGILIFA